jgi:hypothetical protein
MNSKASQRAVRRSIFLEIVLAVVFAALVLVILLTASAGALAYLVAAVVAIVAFLTFHYLTWGRALLKSEASAREAAERHVRQEREETMPADEFALPLTEEERAALIQALEQILAEKPASLQSAPKPGPNHQSIRGVLDRLRAFGA